MVKVACCDTGDHVRVPGFKYLLHCQLPGSVHPKRQQVLASVTKSLPSMWETWIKSLASSFSLVKPGTNAGIRRENQQVEDLALKDRRKEKGGEKRKERQERRAGGRGREMNNTGKKKLTPM